MTQGYNLSPPNSTLWPSPCGPVARRIP